MTKERPKPTSFKSSFMRLLQRGKDAVVDGRKGCARWYYTAALKVNPAKEAAWLRRAKAVDDPQEVMAHAAQALALNPRNERARDILREARKQAGNTGAYTGSLPLAARPRISVPAPLAAIGGYLSTNSMTSAALGAAFLVVLLGILMWSETPATVLAALLPTETSTLTPTPTATSTPAPTATPTFTPSPAPTATSTPTPTYTPSPTPEPSNTPTPTLTPTPLPARMRDGKKWIEIDLSKQKLFAYEGQEKVLAAKVSTGTSRYPTVKGRYKIYAKYRSVHMRGPGYDLPGVPWTMFFHRGFAIHGAYWHTRFGHRMSHGCVNMKVKEAKWLYKWAPKGTLVIIHK